MRGDGRWKRSLKSPCIGNLFDIAVETSLEFDILRISNSARADDDGSNGTETVKALGKIPLSLATLMKAGGDIIRPCETSKVTGPPK
jgi:hypothetical protein